MYRVRAAINGQQGLPGLFTAYYDASGGPSGTDAATVAGRVRGAWDVLKTVVVSGATIQVNPQVDVLSELNGELISSFAIATPAVVTGTGSGTPGPMEVAAGIVYDTGVVVNGRRLRGRSFLNPLQSTSVLGVVPPAGLVTAVNAFGVALITASPPAAVAPHVVWRRPTVSLAGLFRPTTSALIAGKWWVIRSRRD
jgi:hypothetical protein